MKTKTDFSRIDGDLVIAICQVGDVEESGIALISECDSFTAAYNAAARSAYENAVSRTSVIAGSPSESNGEGEPENGNKEDAPDDKHHNKVIKMPNSDKKPDDGKKAAKGKDTGSAGGGTPSDQPSEPQHNPISIHNDGQVGFFNNSADLDMEATEVLTKSNKCYGWTLRRIMEKAPEMMFRIAYFPDYEGPEEGHELIATAKRIIGDNPDIFEPLAKMLGFKKTA